MCLYIKKDQEAQIAKRAIVCYKLVEMSIYEPIYRSWCRLVPIELGQEYTSILGVEDSYMYTVVKEGLHSYTSLEKAESQLFGNYVNAGYKSAIVKCIIPKGSTYFKAEGQFASDRIIYGKEIVKS